MEFPSLIRSNAFDGEAAVEGEPSPGWALHHPPPKLETTLDLPREANLLDWRDPLVGWGVICAAPPGATESDLRCNSDLPQCMLELISERQAPVFRYRAGWKYSLTHVTNYATGNDLDLTSSVSGTAPSCLPQYLLILGTPREVPWVVQFKLNATRYVGRLPLAGAELDNYISHLRSSWLGSAANFLAPVVWATNHGHPDITDLLLHVVADPVYKAYRNNDHIGSRATMLAAAHATRSNLVNALETARPGVIVTTSHGMIGPTTEPPKIPAQLGLLVDQNKMLVESGQVLGGWQPDGAVWYAHACCSAGTSGARSFAEFVSPESKLAETVEALMSLEECVAPFPLALLSANKPARAVIGHVEPTFDITLYNSKSGQWFTEPIISALYHQVYLRHPIGYAMNKLLSNLKGVSSGYFNCRQSFSGDDGSRAQMLNYALRSLDLQGTVLLGDPTVFIPEYVTVTGG